MECQLQTPRRVVGAEELWEPRLTAKGLSTRERILSAAAELMVTRGVAATSIEDVQSAAGGVSASQLYHYLADKATLTAAVIA